MPVPIDCPACTARLFIPDKLWGQRFVGRVQRMACKKCQGVITIDGRSGNGANVAQPDTEQQAPAPLQVHAPEAVAAAPEVAPAPLQVPAPAAVAAAPAPSQVAAPTPAPEVAPAPLQVAAPAAAPEAVPAAAPLQVAAPAAVSAGAAAPAPLQTPRTAAAKFRMPAARRAEVRAAQAPLKVPQPAPAPEPRAEPATLNGVAPAATPKLRAEPETLSGIAPAATPKFRAPLETLSGVAPAANPQRRAAAAQLRVPAPAPAPLKVPQPAPASELRVEPATLNGVAPAATPQRRAEPATLNGVAPAQELRAPAPLKAIAPAPAPELRAAPAPELRAAPAPLELRAPPAASPRVQQPRPQVAARVSQIPPRLQRSQIGPAVQVSAARTDAAVAAVVLEKPLSLPPWWTPEQQARTLIESKFPRLAAPVPLEAPKADPKPRAQLEQNAPLPHEPETTPSSEETTTGVSLAVSRPALPGPGDPNLWLQPAAEELDSPPQAPVVESVPPNWRASGRKRWLGLSAVAVVALLGATACWMLWAAEHLTRPSQDMTQASPAPLPGPIEPETPAPLPLIESAIALPGGEEIASAAARPAVSPAAASDSSAADDKPAASRPSARRASKRAAARSKPEAKVAPAPAPVPYDEPKLKQLTNVVVQKAEQCDRWGRATGTAQLFITFGPSGRVTQARLSGEPIASAPVSRCILHHARAISLPPFNGPAFTVSRKITLR